MRISLAFRAFFSALFNRKAASQIESALSKSDSKQEKLPEPEKSITKTTPAAKTVASRSEALTLLSALQREARFLDLVNESLDQFSDAQIGAAARDVIRDSQKVLKRMFDLQPLLKDGEGNQVALPENASAIRWCVVGSQAKPGDSVTIVHAGWQAKHVQLPQWTGSRDDQLVLAPAEVELSGKS